jgi:hypothetical protein
MTQHKLSPQALQEIRDLASQWGKIVARHAFGNAGPGTDIDLDTMEKVATVAAAGLTEGTLATLLEQQAQLLGTEYPCPDCGRPCTVHREERLLTLRGIQITQREPLAHCPGCRRDFFPPTTPASPGRACLQSHRVAHDR